MSVSLRVVLFALLVLQGSTLSLQKTPKYLLRLRGGEASETTLKLQKVFKRYKEYEEIVPLVGVITLDDAR